MRGLAAATSAKAQAPAALPRALSLTHQHLLACVATETAARGGTGPISLLDVGCGDGRLLEYLSAELQAAAPARPAELFGFDVGDHGVQQDGYFEGAIRRLEGATRRPWRDRLSLISERDAWPYADASFDVMVSNQVLEHVGDHRRFFAETARVLKPGGFTVHLFPLGHVVVEPHLGTPFAHWFRSPDAIAAAIRLSNRLGIGRFAASPDRDLDAYAAAHADFLIRYVNYRTAREMIADAKASRLHASFRYTPLYYVEKLRSIAGRPPRLTYPRPGAAHSLAATALRSVASVTLMVSRDEVYGLPPVAGPSR